VIAHEIWVFGEIDGFEGQSSKPIFAFTLGLLGGGDAASPELGAYAVLTVYHR
jgi:hypothetical protein